MSTFNNVIVICSVEHEIIQGECALCERDSARTECTKQAKLVDHWRAEAARIAAENERLRADADRYRFLRDMRHQAYGRGNLIKGMFGAEMDAEHIYNEEAAICAAIGLNVDQTSRRCLRAVANAAAMEAIKKAECEALYERDRWQSSRDPLPDDVEGGRTASTNIATAIRALKDEYK